MFDDENHNHKLDQGALTEGLRSRPIIQGVRRHWLWIAIAVGILLVLILGILYISSVRKLAGIEKQLQQTQNDPTAKIKEENQQLVTQVGKLIILPTDEQPTIATVTDLSKLKDQPFFAQAQLGDKVLIYSRAKKAILFRPSTNKIVELAPLNTQTAQPEAPTSNQPINTPPTQ